MVITWGGWKFFLDKSCNWHVTVGAVHVMSTLSTAETCLLQWVGMCQPSKLFQYKLFQSRLLKKAPWERSTHNARSAGLTAACSSSP